MTLGLNIKLRRHKIAVQQIALQLVDINTVGGKPAQSLVQRRRNTLHFEDKRRHKPLFGFGRNHMFARQNQKARRVVAGVFNIRRQNIQPINFRREFGSNRRFGFIVPTFHVFARLGGVDSRHRFNAARLQKV